MREKLPQDIKDKRPLYRDEITEKMVSTRIKILEQEQKKGTLPQDRQAELDALKETRYPRIAVLEAEKARGEITSEGEDELKRLRERFNVGEE